jgi:hypothetical protein
MKTGKTLSQLAAEIERQAAAKVDYVADTRNLEMINTAEGAQLAMQNGTLHTMQVGPLAHRQIGERLGIPAKYYDRMLADAPDLLMSNVNNWFKQEPEKRLIRTLDGRARAFLSDRYQRIDNHHVAEIALPALLNVDGLEIMSAEITESRLYIKAVTHSITGKVESRRVGDLVEAGVMISNSEVGLGAVNVMPFFNFLVCTNGMVRNKEGMRSAHTRAVLDRGVLLKVRDAIAAAMNEVNFNEAIQLMNAATTQQINGDPVKAIEVLSNDFGIDKGERTGILRHLIEGGDLSRYGLMNAVTRTAADLESYDRATEFETLGGRILDLPAANWSRIAEAA